jgi:hypothetical protein
MRIAINIIARRSDARGSSMLSALRRVLRFEMTIAEWIGTATILVAPYPLIGAVWALTHSGPVLESILWWPVMLVSTVCLA